MSYRCYVLQQQHQQPRLPVNASVRGPSARRGVLPSATSQIFPMPPHQLPSLPTSKFTQPGTTSVARGHTAEGKVSNTTAPSATPDEVTPLNWSLQDTRTKAAPPLLTPDAGQLPPIGVAQFVPRPPAAPPASTGVGGDRPSARAVSALSVSRTPSPFAQSLDVRAQIRLPTTLPPVPAAPAEREKREFVSSYDVAPHIGAKGEAEREASSVVNELYGETVSAAGGKQRSAAAYSTPPAAPRRDTQPPAEQQGHDATRSRSTTLTQGLAAVHSAFGFMEHKTSSTPRAVDYFSTDADSHASTELDTQSGSDADDEHAAVEEEKEKVSAERRRQTRGASDAHTRSPRSHSSRHRSQRERHHAAVTKALNHAPPARRATTLPVAEQKTPTKSSSGRSTRRPSAASSVAAPAARKSDEALHATEEVLPKGRAARASTSGRRGSHASRQQLSRKPSQASASFGVRGTHPGASMSLSHRFAEELSTGTVSSLVGPSVLRRANNLAAAQWISLTATVNKEAPSTAEAPEPVGSALSAGETVAAAKSRTALVHTLSSESLKGATLKTMPEVKQMTEEAAAPLAEVHRAELAEATLNETGDGSWADFWTSELSDNSFSRDGGSVVPTGAKVAPAESGDTANLPLTPTPGTSASLSYSAKHAEAKNDGEEQPTVQSPHCPATNRVAPCTALDLQVDGASSEKTYACVPHPPLSPQSPSTGSPSQESGVRQRIMCQQQQHQQLYWQHLQQQQHYHQQFGGVPMSPSARYAPQPLPPYRPQPPHRPAPMQYGRTKLPWPQPDIVYGPKCSAARSHAVDFTALTGVRLSDATEVPSPCWNALAVSLTEQELVENSEGWAPCPPAETQ